MQTNTQTQQGFNNAVALDLQTLEELEAPLSDTEWGILCAAAVGGGLLGGILWGAAAVAAT